MSAWLSTAALALTTAVSPTPDSTCLDCPSQPLDEPAELAWEDDGFYWTLGAGPGATFHLDGFNPVIRYNTELGMEWQRGKTRFMLGAEGSVLHYLEAKRAGGGLHGIATLAYGPVYTRTGLGVLAGVPGSHDDRDTRSAISGIIGVGLESRRDDVQGRIGFDYNITFDKAGRVNNTVFLVLQIRFG